VISEVPKCSKILVFRGSIPDPAGKAYSAPSANLWEGLTAPAKNLTPLSALLASFLTFYGSQGQGPTHYRVGNRTNDRFQIYAYIKFIFFPVSENGENVLSYEGADGAMTPPPRISGLEPPLLPIF